jgi:dGTPase
MSTCDFSRAHSDPHADAFVAALDGAAARRAALVLDRQRIVQSAAFRRLQHKTQVFLSLASDHFRTRMTHTLEVAHLARWMADALGLDAALAEVVALAHDLGHPPFGHAGEVALDHCLRAAGGFEHNRHALRVVEQLEHPYPEFRGLNLTRIVRECLAKHSTRYDRPGGHELQDGRPPPPEGAIAALADRMAYALHDTLDALYAGLLTPDELDVVPLWAEAWRESAKADGHWLGRVRPAIDRMQSALMADLRRTARGAEPESGGGPGLSAAGERQLAALGDLLHVRVYRHPELVRMDRKARRIVRRLFDAYVAAPERMPERFAARVAEQGAARVAADYIAGMTDRYCLRMYRLATGRGETA